MHAKRNTKRWNEEDVIAMKKILSQKTCLGIFAGASFIGFIGLTVAAILIIFICFGLVQVLDAITKSVDDQPTGVGFFEETAGWDYRRIPIIEPYHAINTVDGGSWIIESTTDSSIDSISVSAIELDVTNNRYIVTYSPEGVLNGKRFDEVWFVIDPKANTEKGFTDYEEFLAYLAEKGIDTPNLRNVNELYEELRQQGYLEWFPEEYK